MVEYDTSRGGYFYQLTESDTEQGPFTTREGAVADASWRMGHPPSTS